MAKVYLTKRCEPLGLMKWGGAGKALVQARNPDPWQAATRKDREQYKGLEHDRDLEFR